jgi:hypothetical protein
VLQPDSTSSGAADEDLDCKLPLWIPDDAVGIARLLRVPLEYSDCPEEYSEYPWSTQIALRITQSTHLTLWIASRRGSPPARYAHAAALVRLCFGVLSPWYSSAERRRSQHRGSQGAWVLEHSLCWRTERDWSRSSIGATVAQVLDCMLCHTRFTIVRRRHHCRICGRVCCHPCSDEKYDDVAKIRRFGFDTPVRSKIDRIEPRADRRCVLATAASLAARRRSRSTACRLGRAQPGPLSAAQ